jgi:outer membrane protein assembly factor BamB
MKDLNILYSMIFMLREEIIMNKKFLGIGIVFLFLFSTLAQIGLGFNVKQSVKIETQSTIAENNDEATIDNSVVHQWPMFKHDPQHTGLSEYDTSGNPGVEKWKYFSDQELHFTTIIDKDGILYTGDGWNGLHAVYPDGTMKWKIKLSSTHPHELLISEDGIIYVGIDSHFCAYYPNGTMKWILDIEENKIFTGYPTIDSNGVVYVGDEDGYLYAVYPNGTIKWEYKINSNIIAPALDSHGNIYFTSYNGRLYCLNPDGTLKWNTEQLSAFQYGPVIGNDGTIYALPHTDLLFAFNPDGSEKWHKYLSDACGQVSIAPDGTLIVCGQYENVVAMDPSNGDVLWTYEVKDNAFDDQMTGAAISGDGTIYFAYPKCLCALNPDGSLKWKEHLSTDVFPYVGMDVQFGTPSIGSDGTVYVTSWFRRGGSNYTDVGYIHAIGSGEPGAPFTPVLSGKTRGLPMVEYEFIIEASSPSGSDLYYQVDWSDENSYTDWVGPYHSDETIKLKHYWMSEGTYYQIAVRAKDVNGLLSPWGEYSFRTFPFDKGIVLHGSYLLNLLEQYPLMQNLLLLLK